MPKSPQKLAEEIEARKEAGEPQPEQSVSVMPDGALPLPVVLRNTLKGWHWIGYQRVFQILEIACPTDRSFERARKQVLDVANDQERTMSAIIARLMADKGKEQGNATNG